MRDETKQVDAYKHHRIHIKRKQKQDERRKYKQQEKEHNRYKKNKRRLDNYEIGD